MIKFKLALKQAWPPIDGEKVPKSVREKLEFVRWWGVAEAQRWEVESDSSALELTKD